MAYQPSIPTGTVPLNQDYQNIAGNFGTLNTVWNIDHSPLTGVLPPAGPAGYHTSIHLVPQTVPITNQPGYPQLYSKSITDVNTDEALFLNTGTGNRTVQLTVPIVPLAASRGYTFLPGGLLLQWGLTGQSPSNITVTFTASSGIDFPNNLFNVQVTPISGTVPGDGHAATNYAKTGFTITNDKNVSYSWIAIGN